jgi:predicted ATP-dependent endonuclease of OLD family
MYKIQSVRIDNFWQRFNASCQFNEDVNIIIGKNGTGKTTFMNILYSILSVDVDGISDNDFSYVEIKLTENGKQKTIKATKIEDDNVSFLTMEYQISQSKYNVRIIAAEDRRFAMHHRRKAHEESEELRRLLSDLVSLSSLSVYRLRNGQDYEIRDKHGARAVAPVDYRLTELLRGLTHYQLDLSQQAREVATSLQKDVLASILYSKEDVETKGYALDFDKDKEKASLISAYSQLNAIDSDVRRKINFHVMKIDETVTELKKENKEESPVQIDFASLEALRKTQKIIKMSLIAEEKTSHIFSPIDLFLEIIKDFISDKIFTFNGGNLVISNEHNSISYDGLSSGEKQLLILFIETLLQRKKPYVFLTDEPELSLHISWQRKIIPAIKQLNPNAQIIAATHSPEVASKYRDSIYDMEQIING